MQTKDFCPFIKDVCRKDCVFNAGHIIGTPGAFSECELASFIACNDNEQIQEIIQQIKNLCSEQL